MLDNKYFHGSLPAVVMFIVKKPPDYRYVDDDAPMTKEHITDYGAFNIIMLLFLSGLT